jgi:hypothetical protein
MNRIIRVGVLTAVLLTACQSQAGGGLSMNEYTLYLAVVRSRPPHPIVIHSTVDTFGEVSSGKLSELIPGIRSDTIADWIARNEEPVDLPKNPSFQKGYEVVERSEVAESASFYSFSRVGFSKDGQQAFLRFTFVCPALCSEGAFYLLENKQGVWEIVFKSESWKT